MDAELEFQRWDNTLTTTGNPGIKVTASGSKQALRWRTNEQARQSQETRHGLSDLIVIIAKLVSDFRRWSWNFSDVFGACNSCFIGLRLSLRNDGTNSSYYEQFRIGAAEVEGVKAGIPMVVNPTTNLYKFLIVGEANYRLPLSYWTSVRRGKFCIGAVCYWFYA